MPLSNVLRQSIPNPFHKRKTDSGHRYGKSNGGNSKSVENLGSSGMVVIPMPKSKTVTSMGNKRNKKKMRACDTICDTTISHLGIPSALQHPRSSQSSLPQDKNEDMTVLSPTSTLFSPLSPGIRMPTSPGSPLSPETLDRRLISPTLLPSSSASPEPMSSETTTDSVTKTSSMGLKFGSKFFSKATRSRPPSELQSEENLMSIAQTQLQGDTSTKKKKRASAGFLSNTFRSKQQQQQQPLLQTTAAACAEDQQPAQPQVQHLHQQSPSLTASSSPAPSPTPSLLSPHKKRRSLLPKLPLLDTRPKILSSTSKTKKSKEPDSRHQRPSGDDISAAKAKGPSTLLSPFHLLRPSSRSALRNTSNLDPSPPLPNATHDHIHEDPGSQTAQQPSTTPFETDAPNNTENSNHSIRNNNHDDSLDDDNEAVSWENWFIHSQRYHDDRWDRASIFTTDSEMHRLNEDSSHSGYPERNEYWQKHCSIRERRQRQFLEGEAQDASGSSSSMPNLLAELSLSERGSEVALLKTCPLGEQEENEYLRVVMPGERLRDMTSQLRSPAGRHVPQRFPPQRVRFKTYSAYMNEMQRKVKEQTELCLASESTSENLQEQQQQEQEQQQQQSSELSPSSQLKVSDRLIQDVRELHRRSLSQQQLLPKLQALHRDLREETLRQSQRRSSIRVGDGVDDGEDQYVPRSPTTRKQRPPESGILFVPSTTTSATVSVTRSLDFMSQAKKPLPISGSSPNMGVTSRVPHPRSPDTFNDPDRPIGTHDNHNHNGHRSAADYHQSPSSSRPFEDDHCLSQPGLYTSHNHIMPLQQLLELQEQEHWRVLQNRLRQSLQRDQQQQQQQRQQQSSASSSPQATSPKPSYLSLPRSNSPSTQPASLNSRPTSPSPSQRLCPLSTPSAPSTPILSPIQASDEPSSLYALPPTALLDSTFDQREPLSAEYVDTRPQPSHQTQESNSSTRSEPSHNHMLLMLVQGRMQYYEKGARKNGIIWDGDHEMVYDDGKSVILRETEIIDEEDEEEEEEVEEENGEEDVSEIEEEEEKEKDRPQHQLQSQETEQDKDADKNKGEGEDKSKGKATVGSWTWNRFLNSLTPAMDALSPTLELSRDDLLSPRFLRRRVASSMTLTMDRTSPSASALASPSHNGVVTDHPRRHSTCFGMEIASSSTSGTPPLSPLHRQARSSTHPPPNRMSSLGQMRGAKARASVSYSVAPTLITPSTLYGSSSLSTTSPCQTPLRDDLTADNLMSSV
ncbi:hypothetical protein BGX34_000018 [Mortierella sp. NVP85]|nr:hypothetical protein BGX34_000018 [Mortierella sp. NVP85]